MPCIPLEAIIIIVVFGVFISFITKEPKKSGKPTPKREKYTVDVNIALDAKPLFSKLKGLSTNNESVLESLGSFRESEDRMKEKKSIDRKDGGD